ncbi:MAG: hypothetical protein NC079_06955 [Clostridium sp.]|nr:hypothetical protein [Acetatifactor muris]MCM1526873.1 hypothetical protein [Bacteroides sp.]MCM1563334.1 hypothetical protein [Clostridium sp.]
MRKLKILLPVFLLLGCILLCGCDLRNYIYTEDSLKKVAEKSLKKKYGEEFIIHSAWDRDQTRFYADCSPKDNRDVVFLACIYKNGKGVYGDEYPEEVVALEVDEILRDEFEEVFGECYLKVHIDKYYNRPEFDSPQTLTLEEYVRKTDLSIILAVFLNNTETTERLAEKEYQYFSDAFLKMLDEEGIGENQIWGIRLYFVDTEMMRKSKDYFSISTDIRGEFDGELSKYPKLSFSYEDGKMSKSYDEYLERRVQNRNQASN